MVPRRNLPDLAIALALASGFFWLYAHFGIRLAQGIYFDYLNLAFDFDPPYFIDFLVGTLPSGVNYKHPLSMLFRPFASLFLLFGFEPRAAAALVMALFGCLTVALVYAFGRLASFGRLQAAAATLFFGVSSTPLFTAMIVESYGWASFSIVLVWCVYLVGERAKVVQTKSLVLTAVLAAGVTITNIMQAVVAYFFAQLKQQGFKKSLLQTFMFGLYAGLALMLVLAILQPQELLSVFSRPVQTAKEVYWLRTKGAATGISELLLTYFGYSFVSPAFAQVALSPDITMLDFRTFAYTRAEQLVIFGWWAFAAFGCVMGFKHPRFRYVAAPLLVVVVLNLLFHLDYQFRGSLYLYAAHLHFPIFALAMGAAPWAAGQQRSVGVVYAVMLLALAASVLAINVQRATVFVTLFDTLAYPPDSPAINR